MTVVFLQRSGEHRPYACLEIVLFLQEDGRIITKRPEYEDVKAQAICTMIAARDAGMQAFFLDVTNGGSHHILYSGQNSDMIVHTNCNPTEVSSFLFPHYP